MNEQLLNINFVKEVGKRPVLYNYKLPEYSRKDLTDKAWNEVGNEFNLTGSECKEKWKNLRAVFVRHVKPASGLKKKKPYYLFEAMQFTLPFIKVATALTSEHSAEHEPDEVPYLQEDEEEGSQLKTPSLPHLHRPDYCQRDQQGQYFLSESYPRKLKRTFSEVDSNPAEYFNPQEVTISNPYSDRTNTSRMFLLSLLPELDEMTDKQIKMFKRKVLHLIDDIMEAPLEITTQVKVNLS